MLANQTETAAAMSDFIVSKRRESYLGHVSLPISASQKRELLVTPGSGESLFVQDLVGKVSGQVKDDSFISSTLSLAKLARSQSLGRGKSSSSSRTAGSSQGAGSSGYSSPLDYSRAGPSSLYGKHSSSPSRHGDGKRGKGGRGVSFSEIPPGILEVGTISLSLSDRWLFVPPLAGLEGQGCKSLDGRSIEGEVSDCLPFVSSFVRGTHPHFD